MLADSVIAITRQDTPTISGALPAYLFDVAGASLGTLGPPDAVSRIQDIAYAPTGDLYALIDGNAGDVVYNLTTGASFPTGVSVTFNGGGDIAIHGGVIAITRQDSQAISGALPVYLYDYAGTSLGTLGPPDTVSRIQDIAYDPATGDLYALIDGNAGDVVYNLTTGASFPTGVSVTLNGGGNIAIYGGMIAITRQDSQAISGALPVYLFDMAGNSLGTLGPPSTTSRIQDIEFDPASGNLYALVDGFTTGTIHNLTLGTSFPTGVPVALNGGGNLTVFGAPGVPEPGALGLLAVALAACFARRREAD
ncbi:MAG: PEP-CTERM sorting domain-containing protein [Deltaproteobacteria bacterium]|nr:MAG: PEP-CTERM sorting domain-containing protein [Deltaproteobacteria bacterium]